MGKVIIFGQCATGKKLADQCAIQNVSVSVCKKCGNELYKKDGKKYCTWCMIEW